ncbi:MAG: fatty acid--CoA ligase [Rhodanobacteraceae bacterium]|nr:MAG: fatty acid--CoA ligase [Rhodanobacteraceae bacterium]
MFIDVHNPVARTPSARAFPLLLKQLWITPLANSPAREIVYRDGRRFTYRQTWARIARLASALAELGVRPGMTVAVMDWDSHRYFECFFAIPMMGCVLQTVNVRLSRAQVAYTLNHAEADVVLANAEFVPLLDAIRDDLTRKITFVLLSDATPASPPAAPFAGEYETLLARASAAYDFPDFDENTRATTFYTTGTTGEPKGVYYSHRQLVLHTLAIAGWLGTAPVQGRLHREDVYMPITPMFHVHAWGMPYAATLLGLKQVYPGRYDGATLLRLIRDEKVTFSHCVPTLLQMLLDHPDSKLTDLSHLKMVIGGSALSPGLCRRALERGIDVFTGYGMSETCPIQTVLHLSSTEAATSIEQQAELRTLTGSPFMLCDVRVADDAVRGQPHDGVSQCEVVFRSPWLTQGYLKDPARSEALWRGGYLHSGDIGSIDSDGRLRITDRLKDVIKTGGEWVSSLTLEGLISRIPGVSEVAVIAVPDPKWGERPLALVVPQAGATLTSDSIRAELEQAAHAGAIGTYAVPDAIRFVESLAKTSVGKLDKKKLRQLHATAPAAPSAGSHPNPTPATAQRRTP